jgi:hypothetical protein
MKVELSQYFEDMKREIPLLALFNKVNFTESPLGEVKVDHKGIYD